MNFYPKVLAMLLLLVFIPPLGLIFMYKFSPFDRKTNFLVAAACIGFFIYAQFSSPNSADLKLFFTGENKKAALERRTALSRRGESNPQPWHYECHALPVELLRQTSYDESTLKEPAGRIELPTLALRMLRSAS